MTPAHQFAITSMGMTTAVGWDAPTSCASFRAGIARAEELDYAEYCTDEDPEPAPLTGLVASGRALQCEGLGKMVALGADALAEVFAGTAFATDNGKLATGLFLALPNYSLRQEAYVDVNAVMTAGGPSDARLAEELEEEVDPLLSLRFSSECDRWVVERLLRAAGVEARFALRKNIYGDRAGLLQCFQEAMAALRSHTLDRCIVGAIDSLLEYDTLDWALTHGQVKTPDAPCGFSPGEAAVFFEITNAERARTPAAYITEPELVHESGKAAGSKRSPGAGLASAIRAALGRARSSSVGLAIGDLNGEYDRALEWGYAANRLMTGLPWFRDIRSWQPAEAFGETGCAGAGLAIGVGVQAFRRGYALTDSILIWCSSRDNLKGALVLERA